MTLKRGEAGHRLTAHPEGGNAIRDHLLGVGNDLENRAAKRLKGGALGLADAAQVFIDLRG